MNYLDLALLSFVQPISGPHDFNSEDGDATAHKSNSKKSLLISNMDKCKANLCFLFGITKHSLNTS